MAEKDSSVSKGIIETLRKEIKQLPELITQYVKRTVEIVEDTVVVRCGGLDTLEEELASLFAGSVVDRLIVKEVVKTVSESALLRREEKQEEQWYQKIAFKKIKERVYGIELHYTVIGDRGDWRPEKAAPSILGRLGLNIVNRTSWPGDLALIIAYKFVVKIMEGLEAYSRLTHKLRSTPPWMDKYKKAMEDQHGHGTTPSDSYHKTQSDPAWMNQQKEPLSSPLEKQTYGSMPGPSQKTQSGPSWMTQYKKAIKRPGSVSLNIIRCVLVGPPKVGKSCLKQLLVHNEPKEVTTSTPVLESPGFVTFTATPKLYMTHQGSSSMWQPINDDEMGKMVKKWTTAEQYNFKTQETHSTKITRVNQGEAASKTTKAQKPKSAQKSTSTSRETVTESDPKQNKISAFNLQSTDLSKLRHLLPRGTATEKIREQSTALQSAHDHLKLDLERGNLSSASDQGELTLIHVLDSGGQLAFQDTLPLLIGTPCTYITVFNASVDLDQPVDITYRAQDGSETKLDHQLSQWDMMLRTFSSVHTMEYKCHDEIREILQDGSTLPHSRIAVVGTHKDKLKSLPNRDDLKKKIITCLGGIEESKPYHLLHDQRGNPYFLIDNLQKNDQDYINSLRKTLSSEECVLPLINIPLMWLMVVLTTQRVDRKFIRYNELKQFCLDKKYINKENADAQFHSLLMFLHNLGFYAFYDLEGISEADNWVCTDAATLYREVSKLLVVQYKDSYAKEATRCFRKTGIIEDTNVAEVFNEVNIDQEIDHHWFLNVLHQIGIAAKVALERRQQYFIPLVLPFNRAALLRKTSVSPLCFTLVYSEQSGPFCKQNGCDLPRGIFPYLVVHLVNQHHKVSGNEMWKIDPYHSDRTHIVFDCTTFAIYLIEQAGHMELAILLAEDFFPSSMGLEEKQPKLHSLCRDIRQTVTTAINSTCERMFGRQFGRRAKVQSGFLCPCGEGGPHLAFLKSTGSAQCSIGKTLLSRKLSSQEKIWFSPVESAVEFPLFEDVHLKFWIMEEMSNTKPSSNDKCSGTSQHGSNTGTGDVSEEIQSGPSWMTQYKKAIERQGSVSLNIIRCVLVGPPKVGKSCLKQLLVYNEPKKVTISTELLEAPEVVTFTPELYMTSQESSSVWQPVSTDDMEVIVKKWTMEEQYKAQETQPATRLQQGEAGSTHKNAEDMGGIEERHKSQDSTTGEKQSETGSKLPPLGKSTERSIMSEGIESKVQSTPPTLVSSHSLKLSAAQHTDLQECHDKLLHDLGRGNLARALDQGELTLIHLLDSGGQLAFQDTLPLLIGTPCTYITVFNASVDLDQPVDIPYRAQDGSEAKLDHQLSQWDMMLRTFSSVHTMEYKCHDEIREILQDGSTLPHSRIAVVGTHKDKLETLPNRDDLKKKITTFLGDIEEFKPYRLLPDELYFLVDNLHRVDQDYINSLRKTLSSEDCVLPLNVPLMWLMVQLTTQRMDRKFIRYNEMKQFCLNKEYIREEDADTQFHSLVMFLHNLGFYAFYDLEGVSKADNWVCTDAAALYREVSKLLVVQYKDTYTKKASRSFRRTGIVEDTNVGELFNEVNIDPKIDHHWFLNVLHQIGIAAKVDLERCQQYFIPLVLPFNRADLPSKTSVSPLCFTLVFSDQLGLFWKPNECDLPQGIFPYLVVHLANQHHNVSGNEMWKIKPYFSDRTHIVFDCITFAIYLIEQAGHMELAILLAEDFFPSSMGLEEKQSKLHSLCRDIHQTVTTAINSTCERMFGRQFEGRAKVQSGFLCPCGESGPHLTFLKSTESAQCSIGKALLSRKLSFQEKIWFSPVESGVKFSLFEDVHGKFWIMEEISDTKPSRSESAQFDQKTFMEKYRDRFMEYVPADVVVSKWEVYHIIDENTHDEVKKAPPSDKRSILFRYIRNNGSLHTIRKMSDFLIETGEHGYPNVKSLGEDMREDLRKYS